MLKSIYNRFLNFLRYAGESPHQISDIPDQEYLKISQPDLRSSLCTKGIPFGSCLEILGEPGFGKTSLALQLIAEAQKDYVCAWLDSDCSLSATYAENLGVTTDELLWFPLEDGQKTWQVCQYLLRQSFVKILVIDSWLTFKNMAQPSKTQLRAWFEQINTTQKLLICTQPIDQNGREICQFLATQANMRVFLQESHGQHPHIAHLIKKPTYPLGTLPRQ